MKTTDRKKPSITYDNVAYPAINGATAWLRDRIVLGQLGGAGREMTNATPLPLLLTDIKENTLLQHSGRAEILDLPPEELANRLRSLMGHAIRALTHEGLLVPQKEDSDPDESRDQPDVPKSVIIRNLGGVEGIRATFAARDTLDRLVAMRLVVSDSRNADENLSKAVEALGQMKLHAAAYATVARGITTITVSTADEAELRLHRGRFIRSDVRFHVALAREANLGFLEGAIRTNHLLPNMEYFAKSKAPPLKIAGFLPWVIKEHEEIIAALVNARDASTPESDGSMDRLNEALSAHIFGTMWRMKECGVGGPDQRWYLGPEEFRTLHLPPGRPVTWRPPEDPTALTAHSPAPPPEPPAGPRRRPRP